MQAVHESQSMVQVEVLGRLAELWTVAFEEDGNLGEVGEDGLLTRYVEHEQVLHDGFSSCWIREDCFCVLDSRPGKLQ